MGVERIPKTVWWEQDGGPDGNPAVLLVDQTKLPLACDILTCTMVDQVCDAIARLALRGAPALGVGAALALALWSERESTDEDVDAYLTSMEQVADEVASVRPTAVNLSWGARQVLEFARETAQGGVDLAALKRAVVEFACKVRDDDENSCRAIGAAGAELFKGFQKGEGRDGARIMTICNAGSLATAYYGTALGVIFSTWEADRLARVYPCETRPVNQGARLTAWELATAGIPATLICDSMAASVMAAGKVDAVVVGADRICANGDFANKIGTYGLAVLAHAHGIPFYVAAPLSTIDRACPCGSEIPIEERDSREVRGVDVHDALVPTDDGQRQALEVLAELSPLSLEGGGEVELASAEGSVAIDAWFRRTPEGIDVFNPAFDVTPARYVSGYITNTGVFTSENLLDAFASEEPRA